MKNWILGCTLGLAAVNSAWAATEQTSLLMYISPEKYENGVLVGLPPMYAYSLPQGQIAVKEVEKGLSSHFSSVGFCEAGKSADVIAWIKPRLVYNPAVQTYFATLKVQFHLGDGRSLATYKAEGREYGAINSLYANDEAARAFSAAMKTIETQFVNDASLQQAINDAMTKDFTRSPCGMVSVFGRAKQSDE